MVKIRFHSQHYCANKVTGETTRFLGESPAATLNSVFLTEYRESQHADHFNFDDSDVPLPGDFLRSGKENS
jgi:hypothetical protein